MTCLINNIIILLPTLNLLINFIDHFKSINKLKVFSFINYIE